MLSKFRFVCAAYSDDGKTKISADPTQYNGKGTTDIHSISLEHLATDNCYNLFGQKVDADVKGLIIVNGKKMIKK